MKVARHGQGGWHCLLNQREAGWLRLLVGQFPVVALTPAKISTTEDDAKAREREKLLNESLAEHRAELKRQARTLASADRFQAANHGLRFHLTAEEREALLQILNDIRIESWRALGEPEELEMDVSKLPAGKLRLYHLMHLAGYFENRIVEPKRRAGSAR